LTPPHRSNGCRARKDSQLSLDWRNRRTSNDNSVVPHYSCNVVSPIPVSFFTLLYIIRLFTLYRPTSSFFFKLSLEFVLAGLYPKLALNLKLQPQLNWNTNSTCNLHPPSPQQIQHLQYQIPMFCIPLVDVHHQCLQTLGKGLRDHTGGCVRWRERIIAIPGYGNGMEGDGKRRRWTLARS